MTHGKVLVGVTSSLCGWRHDKYGWDGEWGRKHEVPSHGSSLQPALLPKGIRRTVPVHYGNSTSGPNQIGVVLPSVHVPGTRQRTLLIGTAKYCTFLFSSFLSCDVLRHFLCLLPSVPLYIKA